MAEIKKIEDVPIEDITDTYKKGYITAAQYKDILRRKAESEVKKVLGDDGFMQPLALLLHADGDGIGFADHSAGEGNRQGHEVIIVRVERSGQIDDAAGDTLAVRVVFVDFAVWLTHSFTASRNITLRPSR